MRVAGIALLLFALNAVGASAHEPTALWLDVPYVHQPREGCGAASISMVMQYWAAQQKQAPDESSNVDSIQKALYLRKKHGIEASMMQRYLTEHGFRVFAISGRWADLHDQLSKGRPLIAAILPADQKELHYVVIDGVDEARGTVTMNDPAVRKLLTEERAEFEKDWSATHNWLLLAVPSPAQTR